MFKIIKMAVQAKIVGVSSGQGGGHPAAILQVLNTASALVITIGQLEAQALIREIEGVNTNRPMTHDLFSIVLESMEVSVRRLEITHRDGDTFIANIFLRTMRGDEQGFDCRPSDGLIMATKYAADIWIDEDLIEEAGVNLGRIDGSNEDADEIMSNFQDFLQDISPDDFNI